MRPTGEAVGRFDCSTFSRLASREFLCRSILGCANRKASGRFILQKGIGNTFARNKPLSALPVGFYGKVGVDY